MKILFKNVEKKFGSDVVHLREIYIDEKIIAIFYPMLGRYFIELNGQPYDLLISEEQYLTLVWFYTEDVRIDSQTDVFDVDLYKNAKDSAL